MFSERRLNKIGIRKIMKQLTARGCKFLTPKCGLLTCLFVVIFLPIYVIYEEYPTWQVQKLSYDGNLPVLYRDISPNEEDFNIYFLETSYRPTLSNRTFCTLESYCRVNPLAKLWMLVTSPSLDDESFEVVKSFKKICNIDVVSTDVFLTLSDTPLAELPEVFGFWRSSILFQNLSDLLRLAIIHKSGGFYSDTDLLATHPVTSLRNTIAFTGMDINNAAFHFSSHHPYVMELMEYIKHNFYKDIYTLSGPVPVSTVIQRRCPKEARHILASIWSQAIPVAKYYLQKTLTNTKAADFAPNPCERESSDVFSPPTVDFFCKDLTVLEPISFYGVHWTNWDNMFTKSAEDVCLDKIMQSSYGVHLSGKASSNANAIEGSAIKTLSSRSCPVIFQRTSGNIYKTM